MIDVVAKVDPTAIHSRHPITGAGRPAYDPDMMLALVFYAYGTGLRSGRQIEDCRRFRVICGTVTPNHATIARLVVDQETAIEATRAAADATVDRGAHYHSFRRGDIRRLCG